MKLRKFFIIIFLFEFSLLSDITIFDLFDKKLYDEIVFATLTRLIFLSDISSKTCIIFINYLNIIQFSKTKQSIEVLLKQLNACSGLNTIGSFSLNEVFNIIGTSVNL